MWGSAVFPHNLKEDKAEFSETTVKITHPYIHTYTLVGLEH